MFERVVGVCVSCLLFVGSCLCVLCVQADPNRGCGECRQNGRVRLQDLRQCCQRSFAPHDGLAGVADVSEPRPVDHLLPKGAGHRQEIQHPHQRHREQSGTGQRMFVLFTGVKFSLCISIAQSIVEQVRDGLFSLQG